jgi:hypothetical protein
MTKMKTFSATLLLFAAVAAPAFAQDGAYSQAAMGGSRAATPTVRSRACTPKCALAK